MKHFVSGRFESRAKFLPNKIYALVRDSIVRGCAEALVVNEKRTKVLLGRRGIKPWPNWWTFGSRMIVGESPAEATVRTIKADLGLRVSKSRLVFLDTMSLVFSSRQEPPQKNGCHDLALFHLLPISERESASIRLRRSEYREMRWFDFKKVTVKAGFHPATVECLRKVLK